MGTAQHAHPEHLTDVTLTYRLGGLPFIKGTCLRILCEWDQQYRVISNGGPDTERAWLHATGLDRARFRRRGQLLDAITAQLVARPLPITLPVSPASRLRRRPDATHVTPDRAFQVARTVPPARRSPLDHTRTWTISRTVSVPGDQNPGPWQADTLITASEQIDHLRAMDALRPIIPAQRNRPR